MKKNTLLIYSTTDGQTLSISTKISHVLAKKSNVNIISLDEASNQVLNDYDQIVIGASIRYGKHKPELYQFINKYKSTLESKKNGFFSVNVVARKQNKNSPETNPYMKKFVELSSWKPQISAVFAGKLNYPEYRFIDKQMIRLIMFITNGPTDTKKVFEFTDWDKVKQFALKFL